MMWPLFFILVCALLRILDANEKCEGEIDPFICKLKTALNINSRDEKLDKRFQQIEKQLEKIRQDILHLNATTAIEIKNASQEDNQIQQLTTHLNRSETKVRQTINSLIGTVNGTVNTLLSQIENISKELPQLKELLNNVDESRDTIHNEFNKFVNATTMFNYELTELLKKKTLDAMETLEKKHTELMNQPNCTVAYNTSFNYMFQKNRELELKVQQSQQQLSEIKAALETSKNEEWPTGSYCILANGACPKGFKLFTGYLRAINMFHFSSTYIRESFFGSSSINCHGNCGTYGNWVGELNLSTCCK